MAVCSARIAPESWACNDHCHAQNALDANGRIKNFLAFIKTFNDKEFATIYCEREWRSTAELSFAMEDIAMIVLPKTGELFQRFVH
jgi:hypothetical protein